MCVHIEPHIGVYNHQICVSKETNGKDWKETETRRICRGWQWQGQIRKGVNEGTEMLRIWQPAGLEKD